MTESKKLTFKLFRGQNISASRGENEQAGRAKNEKSLSEAARLLDRWEYIELESIDWTEKRNYVFVKKKIVCK